MSKRDAQGPPNSGPLEEPDQRWQDRDIACLSRNEKIRLIIQGLGLLVLLAGFLFFLSSGTVLPLFGTMVIVLLGYRRIDAWLDAAGRSRLSLFEPPMRVLLVHRVLVCRKGSLMHIIEQIPQLPVQTKKHWRQYLIDTLLAVAGALIVTGIIYAFHL